MLCDFDSPPNLLPSTPRHATREDDGLSTPPLMTPPPDEGDSNEEYAPVMPGGDPLRSCTVWYTHKNRDFHHTKIELSISGGIVHFI